MVLEVIVNDLVAEFLRYTNIQLLFSRRAIIH